MSPPAATQAGRKTSKRAAVKGGPAKPPRSSARTGARASARHSTRTVRRSPAPRPARRVSGPAGGRAAAGVAVALPRPQLAPLGPRLVAFATTLPDRSVVDRLVRGRLWIGVLGFLLIGLVTMQVSLLRLNSGIGAAVERSSALERANGSLRAQVSQLESGERIQRHAASLGMVMPPAGQISYLRPGDDVARAVAALEQGAFNDPARAIPLPGSGDPPDPLAVALSQGEEGTSGEDGESAAGEESAEGATGESESGEAVSDDGSTDQAGHDHSHEHGEAATADTASGDTAAMGGTSADG